MRCIPLLALFACGPLLRSQEDVVRATDEILPGGYQIRRGNETWLCHRIVDDFTGAPIADAELFLVRESETPVGGRFWSTRSARSDAEGIVRVRIDDLAGQWHVQVVKAKGYAISSQSGNADPVWRLSPPQDVPVLVCDWRGEPAANALVGFCGCCGHGPDLAWATTDPKGLAILRGIDPHNDFGDLYVQGDGLGLGYRGLQWSPGCAPFRLVLPHSPPLTGKLLDHRGQPVAGAFVGTRHVHRGPWAETGKDGSFRVLGAPAGEAPIAWIRGQPGQVRDDVYFPTPRRWPVTLRLPDPTSERNHEGTVEDSGPAPPAVGTTTITVRAEGEPMPLVGAEWPGRDRGVEDEPGKLTVPAAGPFVLCAGDRRLCFADQKALPPQPIVLRDFAPTAITGVVVDADGKPVAARLRLHQEEEAPEATAGTDGAFRLATTHTGMQLVEVRPERPELLARTLLVPLPDRSDDAKVDLGRLVVRSTAPLRVLGADGKPAVAVRAGLLRAGCQQAGEPRWCGLDAEGRWLGPELRDGDAIVVEPRFGDDPLNRADGKDAVPFRTVLRGAGPWTITAPAGVLALTVTGSQDDQGLAFAHFADFSCWVQGPLELRGLVPGPLRLHLSAPGCRTMIVDTVIPATGAKDLQVALPRQ